MTLFKVSRRIPLFCAFATIAGYMSTPDAHRRLPRRISHPMRKHCLPTLVAFATIAIVGPAQAADSSQRAELSIAAAANLVYALDALDAEFSRINPNVTVTSATGASGSLVAQITQGAPYDVFLSADSTFPRALIKAGMADEKSLNTFAYGRLVLWTTRPGVQVTDIAALLKNPAVQKLAMANADTAPFGRAAKQTLQRLGVWEEARPKIVLGENISQASQFVETGNADAGFVALSIVVSPKLRDKGQWVEVPNTLYDPLEQCAIITEHGAGSAAAARYLTFLRSAAARKILEEFGYGIP